MNKEMIISSSGHDTRVAILEDDQVVEVFIERENQRGVVGNIYKGRVSKVLPGMQSSFIDVGLERDAFLYVSEVVNTVEEFERLESGDEDDTPANGVPAAGGRGAGPGRRGQRGRGRPTRSSRARSIRGRAAAAGAHRRPAERRAGDPRPGRQGAAGHQRRAAHLARHHARAVPRLHADRGPRRRLAQDRVARRARAPPRHRPAVPRGARLHGRRDRPDGGGQPSRARHHQRPLVLPPGLDRRPPEDGGAASAGPPVPGTEPGHQAPARSAHRGLHRDPARRRGGASACGGARRADHAEPRVACEALHEGVPDLRGVRRPGRDRQGAAGRRCG